MMKATKAVQNAKPKMLMMMFFMGSVKVEGLSVAFFSFVYLSN